MNAYRYYKLAADQGSEPAKNAVDRLGERSAPRSSMESAEAAEAARAGGEEHRAASLTRRCPCRWGLPSHDSEKCRQAAIAA
ncbi:MAG: hypothetical protein R3F11_03445 [Verrucomicrobiales bacterium]